MCHFVPHREPRVQAGADLVSPWSAPLHQSLLRLHRSAPCCGSTHSMGQIVKERKAASHHGLLQAEWMADCGAEEGLSGSAILQLCISWVLTRF